jgi:hypothetical protein
VVQRLEGSARCYCTQLIYEKNYGVDSTAVKALLKPDSWVPNLVSIIISLICHLN